MMASHNEASEEQFFDSRDEIASVSDSGSDCADDCCSCSGLSNRDVNSLGYDVWTKAPESSHQRRSRFFEWMGKSLDQNQTEKNESGDASCDEIQLGITRINEDSGAVLRNSNLEDCFVSNRGEDESLGEDAAEENFLFKFKNLDDGTELVADGVSTNGMLNRLNEAGSDRLVTIEEFQKNYGSSPLVQRLLRREAEVGALVDMKNKLKSRLIGKLSKVRNVGRQGKGNLKSGDLNTQTGARFRRVKVQLNRKRSKVLSSLYARQEFAAHEGSILAMKFSPDGQYLASAGEDGVVCVWKVLEDEKPNKLDIGHCDPSCLCFSVNDLSQLASLDGDKEKTCKMKRFGKSSESAYVIFPQKIFRILEEPVHEFHGHSGEVLALSWSKNGHLLSSSVDKTVRLWEVGQNHCLRVFSHNNYVTSVEFNPADDNYFISGSIDGKVRIWEVHGCRVIDWVDIREIVTAVCYYPSGKRGIVGSMDGSCRFYDTIDNQLQLEGEISLKGKKKLACKRITGFQFSPSDPTKVLVTSADSQVRVLCGADVLLKFKGPRKTGSPATASFTADGEHIISAGDDSNVYVWDYINKGTTSSEPKKVSSYERFVSHNASIAVPWCGMKTTSGSLSIPPMGDDDLARCILGNRHCDQGLLNSLNFSPRDCFPLSRGLFLESFPKGSATWPEETLPDSSQMAVSPPMGRSECKLLASACHNSCSSNTWGLVIVTAGHDGRLRTYQNYGLPIRV
ncbi:hypothetical protein RHMOL_Rhmol02G0306800 [Rhododendron molle]|uniref:Uncharacterized protein n=1 Tax=Rhododendron molle TaxID=49168 RepID=A0ACC0PZ72_RHOML|nr:hypothetical protein RHMOL_Rhmol02G0306800 [Rhododendron molle]